MTRRVWVVLRPWVLADADDLVVETTEPRRYLCDRRLGAEMYGSEDDARVAAEARVASFRY